MHMLPCLQKFLMGFVGMAAVNELAKFEVCSFPNPEIIAIEVLVGGCEVPVLTLEEEEVIGGRGWNHLKEHW